MADDSLSSDYSKLSSLSSALIVKLSPRLAAKVHESKKLNKQLEYQLQPSPTADNEQTASKGKPKLTISTQCIDLGHSTTQSSHYTNNKIITPVKGSPVTSPKSSSSSERLAGSASQSPRKPALDQSSPIIVPKLISPSSLSSKSLGSPVSLQSSPRSSSPSKQSPIQASFGSPSSLLSSSPRSSSPIHKSIESPKSFSRSSSPSKLSTPISSTKMPSYTSRDEFVSTKSSISTQSSIKEWYMLSLSEMKEMTKEELVARPKYITVEETYHKCKNLVERSHTIDREMADRRRNMERTRQKIKLLVKLANELEEEIKGFKQCKALYTVVAAKENKKLKERTAIERSMERRIKRYYDTKDRQREISEALEKVSAPISSSSEKSEAVSMDVLTDELLNDLETITLERIAQSP